MSSSADTIILLTGCNSGIGRAAASRLADRGVRLILHARTPEKAARVRDEVASETGNPHLETVSADLASSEAIRDMAAHIRETYDRLDVLINNAGLPGGQEHTWRVNVVAPFLLAHELESLLAAAAGGARVVNVASAAQTPIDIEALPEEAGAEGPRSYGASKLALVMLSFEMAERWRGDGIRVNALHPGTLLNTRMVREHYGAPQGSPDQGAAMIERLALADDLTDTTGEYFDEQAPARAGQQAYEPETRRRLWEITARMAGISGVPA